MIIFYHHLRVDYFGKPHKVFWQEIEFSFELYSKGIGLIVMADWTLKIFSFDSLRQNGYFLNIRNLERLLLNSKDGRAVKIHNSFWKIMISGQDYDRTFIDIWFFEIKFNKFFIFIVCEDLWCFEFCLIFLSYTWRLIKVIGWDWLHWSILSLLLLLKNRVRFVPFV